MTICRLEKRLGRSRACAQRRRALAQQIRFASATLSRSAMIRRAWITPRGASTRALREDGPRHPYGGSMTIANPQSFNRYAYVNNDPVNFVDPSGLLIWAPSIGNFTVDVPISFGGPINSF